MSANTSDTVVSGYPPQPRKRIHFHLGAEEIG